MSGFRKYLVIIGVAVALLWAISIIIYWDVLCSYVGQSIGNVFQAGEALLVEIITFIIVIVVIISLLRALF